MEQRVNAVSTIRSNHAAVSALCVLLNNVSVLAEECTWLDDLDSLG